MAEQRLTSEELREMREYTEAATAGPWLFQCDLQALECAGDDILVTMADRRPTEADAIFIARARTDMPRLLDEVEALIAAEGEKERQVEGYKRIIESMATSRFDPEAVARIARKALGIPEPK